MYHRSALDLILLLAICTPLLAADAGSAPAPSPTSSPAQPPRDPSWGTPMAVEGLPNLHKVSDSLYRSAQPTKEGMAKLPAMGIKTVLSLRAFHSDEDELEHTGLKSERIYIKTWHIEEEDAVKFLKIVTNPDNQPVLVHCLHGADRTGTMIAVYRIVVQGWTKDQAKRELTDGDYGFHPIWTNLTPWLDAMDVEAIRRKAGLTGPTTRP